MSDTADDDRDWESSDASLLASALQKAADALMAAAVNHECPRARDAAKEADAVLKRLGYPHPIPF